MPQQLINPSYFYGANFLPALHRIYSYIFAINVLSLNYQQVI